MKKITLALVALFTLIGTTRADNWMKHLPDAEYVANVSIPGAHDAATGHGFTSSLYTSFAQTQDITIQEQWALGVRAFDLRPVTTDNGNLRIGHGMANTNLLFTDAMLMLRDSLIANPSEFVVLHILHESEYDSSSYDYETLLHEFLNSDEIKDYLVDFRQNLTIADMRGKILMLYRDSYSTKPVGGLMTGWCGYINWNAQTSGKITAGKGSGSYTTSTLYMQDQSDTHEDGMVEKKVEAIKTMLDYTTTHYYTSASSIVWVYNFASAYSQVGSLFGYEFSLSDGYRDNATYTNPAIIDYLAKQPGPTGIILADYVGVDESVVSSLLSKTTYETKGLTLINSIIENNWTYIEYQPANDAEGVQIAIERAEEKDITTNVSLSAAFLIPQSYADAITEAIEAAKTLITNNDNPTEEECEAAINAINEAIEAFDSSPLNAPQEGDLFNIIMNEDGFRYNGYAVTFYTGAYPDAGDYGLQFTSEIDPVYAQAFTFTPSDEMQDGYTISFTDVEGDTRYLCNGSVYGGNKAQIRTTTDEEEAYTYQVILQRDAVGLWYLYSEENGTYVGSNGSSSLYASNSHPNLTFAPTTGISVEVEISDEWGTLILPLPAQVPEGLTAYSCASTADGDVVLTPETTLAANTPYIVNGKGTYTFEGTGAYYSGYDLTDGLLTGTILGSTVPEGAYILADKGEGQAFYIVTEETSLPPYTCYLTVETSEDTDPLGIYNLPGGTVAVKSVEADVDGNTSNALYDLQGRQVTNPRRGIYIRGTQKVLVK